MHVFQAVYERDGDKFSNDSFHILNATFTIVQAGFVYNWLNLLVSPSIIFSKLFVFFKFI